MSDGLQQVDAYLNSAYSRPPPGENSHSKNDDAEDLAQPRAERSDGLLPVQVEGRLRGGSPARFGGCQLVDLRVAETRDVDAASLQRAAAEQRQGEVGRGGAFFRRYF
jgi:hypothetical protein